MGDPPPPKKKREENEEEEEENKEEKKKEKEGTREMNADFICKYSYRSPDGHQVGGGTLLAEVKDAEGDICRTLHTA